MSTIDEQLSTPCTLIPYFIEKGKQLQEYTQIADAYRDSNSLDDIALTLVQGLADEMSMLFNERLNPGTVRNALRYALKGNSNRSEGIVYPGLMSVAEYESLSKKYLGRSAKEQYEQKKGIFSLDKTQLSANAKKAAISRGKCPWSTDEMNTVTTLIQLGYSHSSIADELNTHYQTNRTIDAVHMIVRKLRSRKLIE
jgi:hypothetical protein